ncbi:MAG: protein-L-isoaspartate(D-aspartate) O-methyltransferase [Candidatus Lokiarchaeota archaeon]|nr:protein-L-isoaspartate(D-aspartate) O-methyltransferase [Candidatus Lokiarchaeota archaeon]
MSRGIRLSNYDELRKKLVSHLERLGYVHSQPVKKAFLNIPRELFVPPAQQSRAYDDRPLPTSNGQTISAPHMNAMMCELLKLEPGDKVLEIGTGSGYHAALIAYIVSRNNKSGHVYSIERIKELADFARSNLKKVQLEEMVTVIWGDGTLGYPDVAPFDKILVTAAGPRIPDPLIEQLIDGGILCIPIGRQRWSQKLLILTKSEGKISEKVVSSVVFVPLIGKHGFEPNVDTED